MPDGEEEMAKKRISQKSLKKPDEFISFSSRVMELVIQHKSKVMAAVAGVVILVAVASFIRYSSARAENRGSLLLTQLTDRYEAAVKTVGPQKAYDTTAKPFQAFLDNYSGDSCAKFARLTFAHVCYRAGKLEEAAALYARAMKDFKKDPMMKDLATCALGYTYEETGKFKQAVGLFESLVKDPNALMADEAMFALGRLYGDLEENDKRAAILKQLTEQHPQSIYRDIARDEGA
jgi:TolA-binding protein